MNQLRLDAASLWCLSTRPALEKLLGRYLMPAQHTLPVNFGGSVRCWMKEGRGRKGSVWMCVCAPTCPYICVYCMWGDITMHLHVCMSQNIWIYMWAHWNECIPMCASLCMNMYVNTDGDFTHTHADFTSLLFLLLLSRHLQSFYGRADGFM